MIDVLKTFYTTHFNLGAVSVLLVLLFIFLLTKKNIRAGLVVLVLAIAFNVFIYKKTEGKVWTITIDPPAATDSYYEPQPITMKFSVHKDWSITNEKGEVFHWCWVDDLWDKFSNTDFVAAIWGENSGKKLMKSSESRMSIDP